MLEKLQKFSKKRYLLWGLSFLVAIVFVVALTVSNLIPFKYLFVAILVIAAIYIGLIFLQWKWKKVTTIIAMVAEIVLMVIFVMGHLALNKAMDTLDEITREYVETESMTFYALLSSEHESVIEITNPMIGTVNDQSEQAVEKVLLQINETSGKQFGSIEYADMFEAADALYEGEVQVILLNDAYASIISEIEGYEWFATDTKMLENFLTEVVIAEKMPTDAGDNSTLDSDDNQQDTDSNQTGQDTGDSEESSEDSDDNPKEEDSQDSKEDEKPQAPPVMELMEPPEQVDWETLVNQELIAAPEGNMIIYISGVDQWGKPGTRSRSDVNILAIVNLNTKKILLVSTPRDYYVPLAVNGVKDKLTNASIYGLDNALGTLEALYAIDIQYYVRLNFTGFVGVIDALGGIEVYSDATFNVGDAFSYVEGMNQMSGIEALAFARQRYGFIGGDRARGTHQMEVIKGVINKCMTSQILYNYANVMNSMAGCFSTNLPQDIIASLVRMQLGEMPQWTITSMSVDGYGDSKTTYSTPTKKAYVMIPDDIRVQMAKDSIAAVLRGE